MVKKTSWFLAVVLCAGLLSGCHTVKGMGEGAGSFVRQTYNGIKKDWHDAAQWDKHFREKYW